MGWWGRKGRCRGGGLKFLIFIVLLHGSQERLEAENLFASKEAEEEIKKESTKTVAPKEVPNVSEVAEEEQMSKVVAPTPEQILAIKVLPFFILLV